MIRAALDTRDRVGNIKVEQGASDFFPNHLFQHAVTERETESISHEQLDSE